jgi:Family of unknown function (DUF6885)
MLAGEAQLLPGAAELARLHAAELPQKDDLCGCFCTLLALRLAGAEGLDQDDVAIAAGSTVSPTGHSEALPAGQEGRRDYRLDVPVLDDELRSGTSAGGLARAVAELSGGARVALPVAGPWSSAAVEAVLEIAAAEADAALVLNVATGLFWGSHPSVAELLAYLEAGDAAAGPPPDWHVGHFVGCLGAVRGPLGTLVVIADTYPALGVGAVHLQPRERVADALRRDGMTPGGVLVLVPAGRAAAVSAELQARGLRLELWDNGSVDLRG